MGNSYYWTNDWSEEFYIQLARAGFISTTHDDKEKLILLPELQYDYAVLHFKNLHISKKVKKLLENTNYILSINTRFEEVLQKFSSQHKYNWLKGKYIQILHDLYKNNTQREEFEVITVELVCEKTKKLIAGEVGYIIGKTYTSLSGFSSREKQYNNYGTLQLVLLARYLEKNGFEFWNLGHPHMTYKQKLGCTIYSRKEFLNIWNNAITPLDLK